MPIILKEGGILQFVSNVEGARMIASRVLTATEYFDRILDIQSTALLVQLSIREIKQAIKFCHPIQGVTFPNPLFINENGHLFFDGQEIKKFLSSVRTGSVNSD